MFFPLSFDHSLYFSFLQFHFKIYYSFLLYLISNFSSQKLPTHQKSFYSHSFSFSHTHTHTPTHLTLTLNFAQTVFVQNPDSILPSLLNICPYFFLPLFFSTFEVHSKFTSVFFCFLTRSDCGQPSSVGLRVFRTKLILSPAESRENHGELSICLNSVSLSLSLKHILSLIDYLGLCCLFISEASDSRSA